MVEPGFIANSQSSTITTFVFGNGMDMPVPFNGFAFRNAMDMPIC
jgi:hypothetical protein